MTAGRRGRGRPPRDEGAGPGTRERILASARAEFAGRGYDKASIRAIARGADVDPALVHHYFGTKEQVFGAAVEGALAPVLKVPDALAASTPDGLGEAVARTFLDVWENPETCEPLVAIVRSAVSNEQAAAVFRGLITKNLMSRVAGLVSVPDPEFRVELAATQLVGAALLRYVIKIEPLASRPLEDVVARIAPIVQRHLTDP
ncbi:TetR family transcriptional regulator [Streptomyces xiaopingdaonensis]|uniref:TetR/AcrR family transcriptional regulator n=1 Tax=Streptomyces xiaopingdaonensis TaxID=1565415 RepID=UPI000313171C|nr:TetR family transcriptional regulator [Streptomyces xiaopingdaonensis]